MREAPLRLIVATTNAGKVREVRQLLEGWTTHAGRVLDVIDLRQLTQPVSAVHEDADSFVGNAIKKAVQVSVEAACAALADDSGLEVDALGGRPGVSSARFAGSKASDDENNERLVELLRSVPDLKRTARFRSVVCLALDPGEEAGRAILDSAQMDSRFVQSGTPTGPGQWGWVDFRGHGAHVLSRRLVVWAQGTLEGRIAGSARGTQGFGYDPYFELPEQGVTLAELTLEEKNALSHRAAAIRQLRAFLEKSVT